jgi:hypothetical protein
LVYKKYNTKNKVAFHLFNGKPICLSAVSANIMVILRFGLKKQEKKVFAALLALCAFCPYFILTSMMHGKA